MSWQWKMRLSTVVSSLSSSSKITNTHFSAEEKNPSLKSSNDLLWIKCAGLEFFLRQFYEQQGRSHSCWTPVGDTVQGLAEGTTALSPMTTSSFPPPKWCCAPADVIFLLPSPYLFFFLIYLFKLEDDYNTVTVFAVHQHESTTAIYVSPHPESPSYPPPHPLPLGCPGAPALGALLHALNLHYLRPYLWSKEEEKSTGLPEWQCTRCRLITYL